VAWRGVVLVRGVALALLAKKLRTDIFFFRNEKYAREFGLPQVYILSIIRIHLIGKRGIVSYRDNKKPNIWKLVTKLYKEDIEKLKLGYSNEL
jgi:hypothetical protein